MPRSDGPVLTGPRLNAFHQDNDWPGGGYMGMSIDPATTGFNSSSSRMHLVIRLTDPALGQPMTTNTVTINADGTTTTTTTTAPGPTFNYAITCQRPNSTDWEQVWSSNDPTGDPVTPGPFPAGQSYGVYDAGIVTCDPGYHFQDVRMVPLVDWLETDFVADSPSAAV